MTHTNEALTAAAERAAWTYPSVSNSMIRSNGPHVTLASLAMEAPVAHAIFASLKAEFADPAPDYDVIVDLMVDGSCEDDLSMRRQMVEPLLRRIQNAGAR